MYKDTKRMKNFLLSLKKKEEKERKLTKEKKRHLISEWKRQFSRYFLTYESHVLIYKLDWSSESKKKLECYWWSNI